MPLRRAKPLTWKPVGVSDAIDGSNAFKGAMAALTNLIPSPNNVGIFVPRPASSQFTSFSSFTSPKQVEACLVIGSRVYGLIASNHFSGKSEPFCYDLSTSAFVAISGVSAALLPASQATTGDWQPPHLEMVGTRIMFTSPGFPGGTGPYFGWIDLSGASITELSGNVTSGSKVIQSITGDGTSAPINDGVQPGQLISGTGIPANAYIVSVQDGTYDVSSTGTTDSNTTLADIPTAIWDQLQVGMYVEAADIVVGTYITALPSSGTATLSAAASGSNSGETVNFSGGGSITISANATATNTLVGLTITGGTQATPLWGAGNTNVNPLVAVPAWVSQYNGRAWYAVNNMEIYSDALLPCNVTNASQALTMGDTTPVTCSIGLPLNNQYIGGVVQSLIVVKGAAVMYQITGDQATDNLASNTLNVSVGTLAPNSMCATPLGVAFIAPDGLRIINFQASVGAPIGANGQGVNVPFINALYPSRICAAFNQNTLRISVQNGIAGGTPFQEYWYNYTLQQWTGPHSFPMALIQPCYYENLGFVSAAVGINAALWTSQAIPTSSSTYVENGNSLACTYQTVLLPDNEMMAMNAIVQSNIGLQLPANSQVTIQAQNEVGLALDPVYILAPPGSTMTWGTSTWGAPTTWGTALGYFQQFPIPWNNPLVFKQMSITVTGTAMEGFAIGNLYLMYQILGYTLDVQTMIVTPIQAPLDIVTEGGVIITTEGGAPIQTEGLPG